MYENEKFEKVGEIPAGALVLKFPGTEVSMLYDSGIAYVNENNNVGQLELGIRDIETEEVGEPEGMMGTLGRQLAEQINDPDVKDLIKNMLKDVNHHLFYSKAEDGTEIVTILGMTGKNMIDDENVEDVVVASYSASGQVPNAEVVYGFHVSAVGDRKLVKDKEAMEKAAMGLASKTNELYDKALELAKNLGI